MRVSMRTGNDLPITVFLSGLLLLGACEGRSSVFDGGNAPPIPVPDSGPREPPPASSWPEFLYSEDKAILPLGGGASPSIFTIPPSELILRAGTHETGVRMVPGFTGTLVHEGSHAGRREIPVRSRLRAAQKYVGLLTWRHRPGDAGAFVSASVELNRECDCIVLALVGGQTFHAIPLRTGRPGVLIPPPEIAVEKLIVRGSPPAGLPAVATVRLTGELDFDGAVLADLTWNGPRLPDNSAATTAAGSLSGFLPHQK
ncbi:MAG: hypothetical protein GMKNLPBB_02310 [Myxococcota bacterium]|nr:hypothetical protein [Myxococcota bacterium]